MRKTPITERWEYDYVKSRGIEPLRDSHFDVAFALRKELQKEIFGVGNTEANNIRFYHYAWEITKIHVCEECGKPIPQYSSTAISHILSRGAYAPMAYDLRNFNLLCYECHAKWENPLTRTKMRIWEKNSGVISTLKQEYQIK